MQVLNLFRWQRVRIRFRQFTCRCEELFLNASFCISQTLLRRFDLAVKQILLRVILIDSGGDFIDKRLKRLQVNIDNFAFSANHDRVITLISSDRDDFLAVGDSVRADVIASIGKRVAAFAEVDVKLNINRFADGNLIISASRVDGVPKFGLFSILFQDSCIANLIIAAIQIDRDLGHISSLKRVNFAIGLYFQYRSDIGRDELDLNIIGSIVANNLKRVVDDRDICGH